MRIFLTGATGFVGSHILPELLEAGHRVLGLCRSDAGAKQLAAKGAEVHQGDLDEAGSARAAVAIASDLGVGMTAATGAVVTRTPYLLRAGPSTRRLLAD